MLSSGEKARPFGRIMSRDDERHRAEIGRDAIDAGDGHVPLVGRGGAARIGEIDRAVGFDDHVVRTQQALAAEAVGDDRDAAVRLITRDAAGQVLGREDAALQVAGDAVRLVGLLHGDGRAVLARRVSHPARGVDVVEEEIALFGHPQRTFGRADVAAKAGRELTDRLDGGDDVAERAVHLLDASRLLSEDGTAAHDREAAGGTRHAQHVPT